MSFTDAMYGNSSEMDHLSTWDDRDNGPVGHQRHLFDVLEDAGYQVSGLGYPVISKDDVNDWKLVSLRRQIGVATQEPFLFSDTIGENIRFGVEDATFDQVQSVAGASAPGAEPR